MIIKEHYEDFLVNEIPLDNFCQEMAAQFHVYKLKKTNYTTERAIAQLCRSLRIPRKYISFAGTKDKQAITTQYITISGAKKEKVLALKLKDLELEFVGYRKERLALGLLKGNAFSILVKDVDMIEEVFPTFYVPNYFDEQRFSSHNVELGKLILKKKYKEAVEKIMEIDSDYSEKFTDHLTKQTNDFIGALRLLPRKTLMFYVHAVQSYIFNEQLKKKFTTEIKEWNYSEGIFSFPKEVLLEVDEEQTGELIGFLSEEGYDDIEPRDFINKALPELSLEGGSRPLYSKVDNCVLTQEKEGVRVEFILRKGSYATIVLKQLFSK